MNTQLSKRSQAALEIITAGGYIRHGLVTQYRGGEKFEYELFDVNRQRVSGFGCKALEPLTHVIPRDWNAIFGTTAQRIFRLPQQQAA
jgi:hypothetical protein